MSIENIRSKNPDLKIFETLDKEFSEYGIKISGICTDEIIEEAKKLTPPESGSLYIPSISEFENLKIAKEITERGFGTLETQIGYCCGRSNFLNALEWHSTSEINIATTDLVLFLAKRCDLKNNKIDSSAVKAFYVRAGEIIEVFATTLHFCPIEVSDNGFGCVVALPKGTNTPLEKEHKDPYLFRKNKWIIAHNDNTDLQSKGVLPGISGENYKITY